MIVNVRLFAILRDRAATSETKLNLNTGTTVTDAVDQLVHRYPATEPFRSKLAYAVNEHYVPANTELHDGDELALIPPVSGG